ncbi:MAG: hypothetical protein ACLTYN_03585 [Dysosmobacter welbionis]
MYSGAIYEYQNSFLNYLHLEDMGIFTACDKQNQSPEKLEELYQFESAWCRMRRLFRPLAGSGLAAFDSGGPVRQGSAVMAASGWYSQEACGSPPN